jgi:glycosyltransferase involved in cell wall biosynthesis
MKPLISVIVPTYQHAATLPACLDSILAQAGVGIEVIVVDDGSTDNTPAVLKKYANRVTVIRQENKGSNPARNRGLYAATGKYLMFADADVVLKPGMLTKCFATLESAPSNVGYAYTGFRFGWKVFRGVPFSAARLRRVNYIHTTCLVKHSVFSGFDETIKRFQDWDVWLTMLERGFEGVLVPASSAIRGGVWFNVRIEGASRIGSSWLPSFVYQLPWRWLPWKPARVSRYEAARKIIVKKHHLV